MCLLFSFLNKRHSFVKNAGLGFAIPYLHNGEHHEYLPDFIVRLAGGGERYLILETKGYDPLQDVKRQAARRWVRAVNAGDRGDDVLERAGVADAFARQVLALDASHGTTVGVFGPWGSGKTSFVNLARKTFEGKGVPVPDFNPWLFSGAEQLVERFFAELSANMHMTTEEGNRRSVP